MASRGERETERDERGGRRRRSRRLAERVRRCGTRSERARGVRVGSRKRERKSPLPLKGVNVSIEFKMLMQHREMAERLLRLPLWEREKREEKVIARRERGRERDRGETERRGRGFTLRAHR